MVSGREVCSGLSAQPQGGVLKMRDACSDQGSVPAIEPRAILVSKMREDAMTSRDEWLPRFMKFVRVTDTCWLWTSANVRGYGRFGINGRTYNAPRLIWTALLGPIASGMQIDHLCRNEACVRPSHLEVVTPRVNVRRSMNRAGVNARKTHCVHGHELSGNNLRMYTRKGSLRRECRTCMKIANRAWKQTHKEVTL